MTKFQENMEYFNERARKAEADGNIVCGGMVYDRDSYEDIRQFSKVICAVVDYSLV